jgi:hypothetical protein
LLLGIVAPPRLFEFSQQPAKAGFHRYSAPYTLN